jgi:hypothetical protein
MKKIFSTLLLVNLLNWAFAQQKDFFETTHIPEIRISFKQKNWMSLLDSLKISGSNMLIGDVSVDGTAMPSVGVRYRGSSSFKYGDKRNPYYIKLNLVNSNANYQGASSITLSTALRDPSMVREVMGYEIARKYMPAPRANYAKLFVNNEYIGLYINVESIEDNFLNRNFGVADNTLIRCNAEDKTAADGCKKSPYSSLEFEENETCYLSNYDLLSKQGWDDFFALVKTLNKNSENIEKYLDVDKTLWMLAYNNVLVNLNSYTGGKSQNYYLYKDKQGRFVPVLWDLNLNFGSFKNTGVGESDLNLSQLQELDPMLHKLNSAKPLISKLLANPLYEKIYIAHCKTILAEWIDNGQYLSRAKQLQEFCKVPFMNDNNKYYKDTDLAKSLTSTIGEHSKIPGLSELMTKRSKYLKKHWAYQPQAPEVADVKTLGREKYASEDVKVFKIQAKIEKFPKKVKIMYRTNKEMPYMEALMHDDGSNSDGKAGDKIFGVVIDPKGAYDSIEYYIIAENTSALSFYPPNYTTAPAQINLMTLNK